MKRKALLFLTAIVIALPSCTMIDPSSQDTSNGTAGIVTPLNVGIIGTSIGDIRFVPEEGDDTLSRTPFNTFIQGKLYHYKDTYTEEELESIKDNFDLDMEYYSALSDRHYDYTYKGEKITNLKTINDSPRGTPIEVDPFLFSLLKESYEFSLNTEDEDGYLLFDIFTGKLNDYYEDKLDTLGEKTSLNLAMYLSNNAEFSTDVDMKTIQSLVEETPVTKDEAEGLLEFDEENSTVTFNSFVKDGKIIDDVEISLSAVSKGFATQWVSDALLEEYPDISLLIDSGSSSIKAVGQRPDGKAWTIRLTNPLYSEARVSPDNLNPYEVAFVKEGAFSLSTSGYYEHYFYVYDPEEQYYTRREHILLPKTGLSTSFFDQVSVFNEDAGLADMYTTTLMLANSVKEAVDIVNRLDEIYGLDTGMILCFKSQEGNPLSLYRYGIDDVSNLSAKGLPQVYLTEDATYSGTDVQDVDGRKLYVGDYSDLDVKDIDRDKETVSQRQRKCNETYWVSADIYDGFSYLGNKDLSYPDERKAVLYKGE